MTAGFVMSASRDRRSAPAWNLADRLRKSLQVGDVNHAEMATYLGVSRNTLTNYVNGRTRPDDHTLELWARKTEVPYEWLLTGNDR